jgi:2'-phosphotransferase
MFLSTLFVQGLNCMRRNHIHFAKGDVGSDGVISGMRGNCEVKIFVNLKRAIEGKKKKNGKLTFSE